MKMTIDLPVVSACEIEACACNTDHHCHARAITVGDGESPLCDTLYCGSEPVHDREIRAGVGACKITRCSYNDDLECSADSIRVGQSGNDVQCMTYNLR